MKKIPFILALLLLLSTLLGGCFGMLPSSTGPVVSVTPSPYVDPQLLIPKDEAEKLVGNALKNPQLLPSINPVASASPVISVITSSQPSLSAETTVAPLVNPAQSDFMMCFYETEAAGGHFLQVSLLQTTDAMAAQKAPAKLRFDNLKSPGPMYSADPMLMIVNGVGDQAFIQAPGIHIMFQGYYIVIGLGDPYDETVYPNGKTNEEMLIEAGKLAVKNLAGILGVPVPAESPTAAAQ